MSSFRPTLIRNCLDPRLKVETGNLFTELKGNGVKGVDLLLPTSIVGGIVLQHYYGRLTKSCHGPCIALELFTIDNNSRRRTLRDY